MRGRFLFAPLMATALMAGSSGADVSIGTPQDFGKMLADEYALWVGVVKAANITLQ